MYCLVALPVVTELVGRSRQHFRVTFVVPGTYSSQCLEIRDEHPCTLHVSLREMCMG